MKIFHKISNAFVNKVSSNQKKAISNISWAIAGKFINLFGGLVIGIFVARYLGPEKYGIMNYVISYVTIFTFISNFGLDNITIRELSKKEESHENIMGTAFIIRIVMAIFTILLIAGTLFLFEKDKQTIWLALLYSLTHIFLAPTVISNFFTAKLENKFIVQSEVYRAVMGSILKIIAIYLKASLFWFVLLYGLDFVFLANAYHFFYRTAYKGMKGKLLVFNRETSKYLVKESYPLLLSSVALIIYQYIDQILIRNMINNEAVGQYSVAMRIVQLVLIIPQIISQTFTPFLIRAMEKGEANYIKRRQQFMDYMTWGPGLASLFICVFAYLIIVKLFGKQYQPAVIVLQILAWKGLFSSIGSASGQLIIIENKHRNVAIRNVLGMVINTGLNYWFIPIWGIAGSASATLIAFSFATFYSHAIIPEYRYMFKIQVKAMRYGLIDTIAQLRQFASSGT
jgi:O-antigen/teichoic acid export membrane protein